MWLIGMTEGGVQVGKHGPAPVVRHSYAADPDAGRVAAALERWREALARKMALGLTSPGESDPRAREN